MWSNTNYRDLPTFHEYVESVGGLDIAFNMTNVDEATQEVLYQWYYDRKCNNADHAVFKRQLSRLINTVYDQYVGYLRIQNTEFDPMVTNYLEHWVGTNVKGTGTSTRGVTGTGGVTTTSELDGTNTTTGLTSTNTNDEGQTISSGTTNVEVDQTVSNTGKTISTTSGDSDTASTTESNTQSETNTNAKDLTGDLPMSGVYGEAAIPDNLNWTYLSGQSENQTATDTSSQDSSSSNSSTNTTGESEVDSNNTQGTTGTTDTTSSAKVNDTNTGTSTTNNSQDVETSQKGKITVSNNTSNDETGTTENNTLSDMKEVSTGRGGAPQDLLNSARDYIVKTNAINWFIAQIDACFMQVYEY